MNFSRRLNWGPRAIAYPATPLAMPLNTYEVARINKRAKFPTSEHEKMHLLNVCWYTGPSCTLGGLGFARKDYTGEVPRRPSLPPSMIEGERELRHLDLWNWLHGYLVLNYFSRVKYSRVLTSDDISTGGWGSGSWTKNIGTLVIPEHQGKKGGVEVLID